MVELVTVTALEHKVLLWVHHSTTFPAQAGWFESQVRDLVWVGVEEGCGLVLLLWGSWRGDAGRLLLCWGVVRDVDDVVV
jgi:hypothetical protein